MLGGASGKLFFDGWLAVVAVMMGVVADNVGGINDVVGGGTAGGRVCVEDFVERWWLLLKMFQSANVEYRRLGTGTQGSTVCDVEVGHDQEANQHLEMR